VSTRLLTAFPSLPYWIRLSSGALVNFRRILHGIMHAISVSLPYVTDRFLGALDAIRRILRPYPDKFFYNLSNFTRGKMGEARRLRVP
jgi:hypothetical protein